MKEPRKSLGAGAIALLPIACCLGLPLLVAAGTGAATLVWGAGVIAALALAVAAVVLLARRRARAAGRRVPPRDEARPERASNQREEVVQR
jgi:heme exporter protein D